jgi:DNA-binding NtrC family response regulator
LENYSWPGNIRELRNVLERALLLSHGEPFAIEQLPGLALSHPLPEKSPRSFQLDGLEEEHIKSVINHFGGDTQKAAEALGISRTSLYRKLKIFTEK